MSRVVGSIAATAVAVALALPGPALADTAPPDALGWWTRRPGAAARGDGGFEIAAGLQGEESTAAVRVALPSGTSSARLVLTEVPGAVPSDTAFRACPASSPWEPADAGAWDARPTADCEAGSVEAAKAGPGRWSVDLSSLAGHATGSTLEVVLLPANADVVPGFGSSVGFTASFSAAEVVTDRPAAAPAAPPAPTSVAAGAATRPASPPVGTPAVAVPAVRPPLPTPSVAATIPTTSTSLAVGGGTGEAIAAPMFELTASDDHRPWGRLLLLVPLSAATGLAATAARNLARRRADGTVLVS